MEHFKVKIAGHIADIETLHVRSKAICTSFFTDESSEFLIHIKQEDIDQKREFIETISGRDCTLWDGALETLVLHEKLSLKLLDYGVFLIHGAAIAYHDNAYIFTARSGTGKTTHIIKWIKHLDETVIVNGDKPYINTEGASVLVCSSPWAGKENLYSNTTVSLKSVILMERAEDNCIEKISFSEAFPYILQQIYHPEDDEAMRKTLGLIQRLSPAVSFYRFQCNNFKNDCINVAYNSLIGDG